MIETPKQIWIPKVKNLFILIDYLDDIDDGFFDYIHYGKAVFKPKVDWKVYTQNDIITYVYAEDCDKWTKDLKIGDTASA